MKSILYNYVTMYTYTVYILLICTNASYMYNLSFQLHTYTSINNGQHIASGLMLRMYMAIVNNFYYLVYGIGPHAKDLHRKHPLFKGAFLYPKGILVNKQDKFVMIVQGTFVIHILVCSSPLMCIITLDSGVKGPVYSLHVQKSVNDSLSILAQTSSSFKHLDTHMPHSPLKLKHSVLLLMYK